MSIFTKSVDSIVASIATKIEQLHFVADLKTAEAEDHEWVFAEKAMLASEARAAAARAKAIAINLAKLIESKL